jgi:hypothetical protein
MNLNQINRGTRVERLAITKPAIVHLVPEFGHNAYEYVYKMGLVLNNLQGLVVKPGIVKVGTKVFNTRKNYLHAKAFLSESEDKTKYVQVYRDFPKKIDESRYLIIDHTMTSNIAGHISDLISAKRALIILATYLKNEYEFVKKKYPAFEHVVIFLLGPKRPENSMLGILERLRYTKPEFIQTELNCYDNFILVNFQTPTKAKFFAIAGRDKKHKPEIYINNIAILDKLFKASMEQTIPQIVDDVSQLSQVPKETSALEKISKKTIQKSKKEINVKDNSDEVNTEVTINSNQFKRILKKYQIKDDTTANNIKASVQQYLSSVDNNINQDDLELTILKSINFSVFNTPKIDQEYLDNPVKLFSKLNEINTFYKEINIPKTKTNYLIQPKDAITLKHVTGLVRQEYEFSDNIHDQVKTLFESLNTRVQNPIKIKKIKHEYKDDDLNRFIEYTITLENKSAGSKEPYDVKVKIPALTNNKYFKLNGKNYILSNQQVFTPITKTSPSETRLLSSFSIITLSTANLKFNISQIEEIIKYIELKYPELIIETIKDKNKIISTTFTNNSTINLYNDNPTYTSPTQELYLDDETNSYILKENNEENNLPIGKSEFLFEKLIELMKTINPDEELKKSQKTIPYIQIYNANIKTALIVYLWQQIGLLNALTKLGIDYEFDSGDVGYHLNLKDKVLVIKPETRREQLIVNGLSILDKRTLSELTSNDLSDTEKIGEILESKYGKGVVYRFNLNAQNMIDPITKDLLKFQDKPTNLTDLICGEMVNKLLNDNPNSLTDLSIYRSRQAEIMFTLLYKELMMAHNRYTNRVKYGDDNAKVFLKEDYVIECLLGIDKYSKGSSVLEYVNPYNPVIELKAASKTIKTGPMGVPNKRSFQAAHRGIHPSYYGNLGETFAPLHTVMYVE